MEKNRKDQKLGSASSQQSQTIEPQGKQDIAQPNATPNSHDNVPNSKQQQQPPIVQWPYTPQSATEQFMAMSMPNQAPSPGLLGQWHQGQMFAQSTPPPFWQPPWPAGSGPFLGANVPPIYQTFTPVGTTDPSCQGVVPGGTSPTTQTLVPNMCYPGYTFPGFPGPCDPSSWYQLQHPYVYNSPSALGFSSGTPTMHGCSASGEQSFQKGTIRPTAKLSQKHQQLWEAQSAENIQLWTVINKLQAEVSDYKDRLTKLEEAVSSLKQKKEAPPTEVNGNIPLGTGQPAKRGRGRPKRALDSAYALQESLPRTRGRKPAPSKAPFEIKSPIFEKVILKKADNKEIANHKTTSMAQQQTNEKISNAVTHVNGNIQNNQSNSLSSAHKGHILQEYLGPQSVGRGTAFASGERVYFKNLNLLSAYQVLPGPSEVTLSNGIISARYLGNTGNGNHGSTSCIPAQNSARELLDAAHQGFVHSGSVTKQEQGAEVTPGQNSANEEDRSEDLEDTNSGSAEDENEEEMGEDTSSSAEEVGVPKDEGGCGINNDMVTSPKGLSSLNNW